MYYITKEGIYDHGVYWVGFCKREGEAAAAYLASADVDDYHEWVLYEYKQSSLKRGFLLGRIEPTPESRAVFWVNKLSVDRDNCRLCDLPDI